MRMVLEAYYDQLSCWKLDFSHRAQALINVINLKGQRRVMYWAKGRDPARLNEQEFGSSRNSDFYSFLLVASCDMKEFLLTRVAWVGRHLTSRGRH
ncbi:hypothetical protein TNIN_59201 [Trichonephila inaurata madagascariensis]|uniref:Uncharacterized protein n=1 Tax=Trichonephila inaurata madagascariensis TaxID=2747483 RepID=A0A8X6MLL8_9ARAC|nr:hypothetical protein TNIN_59201 [Trichonephila inaurata madagascariensis]